MGKYQGPLRTLLAMVAVFSLMAMEAVDASSYESKGSSHGHTGIEAVAVSLASSETTGTLQTDWLHYDEEVSHDALSKEVHLSGLFWFNIALFAGIFVLVLYLGVSGIFARFKLSFKLGLSFGIMIAMVCALGIASEIYLKRLDGVAHYDIEILHLEELGSEQYIAQNNFLLHGLSNEQYGEEQIEHLYGLISKYREKLNALENNVYARESHIALFGTLEANMDSYEKHFREIVQSYHEIAEGKKTLEKYSHDMSDALETMVNHHLDILYDLEKNGGAMTEIQKHTEIVQHLETAEIQVLKTTIEEVSFLLDKNPTRITAMEKYMGVFLATLDVLGHELEEPKELASLKTLKGDSENYIGWLRRVIKDEAIIVKDVGMMSKTLDDSRLSSAALAHVASLQARQLEFEGKLASLVSSLFALATGILFTVFVTRSVTGPLKRIVDSLSEGAEKTDTVSRQVSNGSQALAEGASEQASALEETSASLEEISSTTQNNADHATKANGLARETCEAADLGVGEMKVMGQAMNEIQSSSDEISKIIKTIDDIAFQTNILALNAAVEAARAGEAGQGFAVVADEVRSLAQRSAVASRETAEKIECAIQKSSHGVEISNRMTESLNTILGKAKQVDELLSDIENASSEQSQGIGQVNHAVTQMESVTQSNAANAEETASASEELSAQAKVLRTIVEELHTIISGTASGGKKDALSAPGVSSSSDAFNDLNLNRFKSAEQNQSIDSGEKAAERMFV